jgi:hypothetical protein
MLYLYSLREIEIEINIRYLTLETAKRCVIETIEKCQSTGDARDVSHVKFITGRENHINPTEDVLYEAFPSWMEDTEIKHLIEHCEKCDGYYLVYIDRYYAPTFFTRSFKSFKRLTSRYLLLLSLLLVLLVLLGSLFGLFYIIIMSMITCQV